MKTTPCTLLAAVLLSLCAPPPAVAVDTNVWRTVGGKIEHIYQSNDWHAIYGSVRQVVLREGQPVYFVDMSADRFPACVMLYHFPAELIDNQTLDEAGLRLALRAKLVGNETYETAGGGTRTVRKFDFGIPCGPPPELIARERARAAADQARWRASAERNKPAIIAWEKDQAERGVASGQYALGMRYLRGDGVEQSDALARAWVEKAAAQGHAQAKASLK